MFSNYSDSNDGENHDLDVTWTNQEALNVSVGDNQSAHGSHDPLSYRSMSEGKEKRKRKKKHHKGEQPAKRQSQETARTQTVPMQKEPGYSTGLSRGFELFRTLKNLRHCVSQVANPMTKAQRRTLRRKLDYHVDDMERIVVGVNPRASELIEAEETASCDEEMRDEVNALIDDALDEATLQGKIVHTGYFETRMSELEMQCAALKSQLEKITTGRETSAQSSLNGFHVPDSQACSSTSKEQEEGMMRKEPSSSSEQPSKRGRPKKTNTGGEDESMYEEKGQVGLTRKRGNSLHPTLSYQQEAVVEQNSTQGSETDSPGGTEFEFILPVSTKDVSEANKKENKPDSSAWTNSGNPIGVQTGNEDSIEGAEPENQDRPETGPFTRWSRPDPKKRGRGRPRKHTVTGPRKSQIEQIQGSEGELPDAVKFKITLPGFSKDVSHVEKEEITKPDLSANLSAQTNNEDTEEDARSKPEDIVRPETSSGLWQGWGPVPFIMERARWMSTSTSLATPGSLKESVAERTPRSGKPDEPKLENIAPAKISEDKKEELRVPHLSAWTNLGRNVNIPTKQNDALQSKEDVKQICRPSNASEAFKNWEVASADIQSKYAKIKCKYEKPTSSTVATPSKPQESAIAHTSRSENMGVQTDAVEGPEPMPESVTEQELIAKPKRRGRGRSRKPSLALLTKVAYGY